MLSLCREKRDVSLWVLYSSAILAGTMTRQSWFAIGYELKDMPKLSLI